MTRAELDPVTRRWRVRVFTATWLSYFGYYFSRKPFYIAKATLEEQLGFDAERLAFIGMAYLVAYTVGQFAAGWFGNRSGPRLMLLTGMLVTAGVNLTFGFAANWGTFAGLMVVNGLAQATGWSGNVGSMAAWFTRRERGTVMGFWATNFQAGGVAANTLAAWALGAHGYRWAFFAGSLVTLAIWAVVLLNQRDKPEDVGLPALVDDTDPTPEEHAAKGTGWTPAVRLNVALLGAFYFNVKFIRYALWSWAPYLLQRYYGLAGDDAGFASTVFDVAGIAGVVFLGVASDRWFGGRRVGLSLVFLLAMVGACLLLYLAGATSLVFFTVCLGLIGFSLYGPDAILTSAGAIDVGTKRGATLAAGIINGLGSVGSVAQEFLFGRALAGGVAENVGVVFGMLLTTAGLAAACLAIIVYRNRTGRADL
ncbi:MAG: MFS transporter [Myxococcales bacterium]|nr:MFS transporter [Myxococcales bacterium]